MKFKKFIQIIQKAEYDIYINSNEIECFYMNDEDICSLRFKGGGLPINVKGTPKELLKLLNSDWMDNDDDNNNCPPAPIPWRPIK